MLLHHLIKYYVFPELGKEQKELYVYRSEIPSLIIDPLLLRLA